MNPSNQKFIDNWQKHYGQRTYDFSKSEEQELFYEGVTEIVKHIIHTSPKAALFYVAASDDKKTLFIDAGQSGRLT